MIDRTWIGQRLAAASVLPIERPLLHDIDFARQAGFPDVFAQGMLGMAWLGRLVISWVPQTQLRSLNVRFADITHLRNDTTCTGRRPMFSF